tara:strand:+ start:54171 stop:55025 length:855 start_codon:yes stop_codon:yes gene_type:complete
MAKKIFMFPGQGSQSAGMGGKELFDQFPNEVAIADEVLGYSIQDLCLNDPEKQLTQTEYTQPALYVVNHLLYLSKYQNQIPDYIIGHSLGEYNALLLAGAFEFAEGLKMVKKRGALMSLAKEGTMAAIIGVDIEVLKKILSENNLSKIDIANINSFKQTVISGSEQDIKTARDVFEKVGNIIFFPLNVSGAFHSRYMQGVADQFSDFIKNFSFSNIQIPVISNYSAKPYSNESIHENLVKQIYNSVQWVASIQYCKEQDSDCEFTEVGPGKVLTNLIKKIEMNS